MTTSDSPRTLLFTRRFVGTFLLAMGVGLVSPTGCGGVSNDRCRLHPEDCRGAAGTLCVDDSDCSPGLECCNDDNN